VSKQELHADVSDPSGLTVGARDGLDASASHKQQADVVGAVERLACSDIERERALFGFIANAVDGLQVVDFRVRFEAYTEIYDLQAINRIGDEPKQRSLTLDIGARQSLDRANHVRLLFMGGRGIQAVTRANGEPTWIAYIGVQLLLGHKGDD